MNTWTRLVVLVLVNIFYLLMVRHPFIAHIRLATKHKVQFSNIFQTCHQTQGTHRQAHCPAQQHDHWYVCNTTLHTLWQMNWSNINLWALDVRHGMFSIKKSILFIFYLQLSCVYVTTSLINDCQLRNKEIRNMREIRASMCQKITRLLLRQKLHKQSFCWKL